MTIAAQTRTVSERALNALGAAVLIKVGVPAELNELGARYRVLLEVPEPAGRQHA